VSREDVRSGFSFSKRMVIRFAESWQANGKRMASGALARFAPCSAERLATRLLPFRFAQENHTANLSDSPRPPSLPYLPLDGRRAPQPVVSWRSINPRNG
jgi:hypothetical protein